MSINNGESEDDQSVIKDDNHKPPILTKYNSTLHEKHFPSALSNGFDKNLIVEKALFDSTASGSTSTTITTNIPQPPTTTTSTPALLSPEAIDSPPAKREMRSTLNTPDVVNVSASKVTHKAPPPLTTSMTLPTVSTLQSVSGPSTPITAIVNNAPSQSTPLLMKSKTKSEDRRTIKRKKISPMSGAATPSEVFHRNLVDAVSNVEDSDENEQYVYPYSGNNTDTTATYHMNSKDTLHRTTSSSLYRPQSTRSFANISQQPSQEPLLPPPSSSSSRRFSTSTGFLGDLLRPLLFKNKSETKAALYSNHKQAQSEDHLLARPKLRTHVMDHPFTNQSKPTQYNNHHEWLEGGKYSPPLYQTTSSSTGHKPRQHSSRNMYYNYGTAADGGYTTDDEEAQHVSVPVSTARRLQQLNRHNSNRKKKNNCSRLLCNALMMLFFATLALFLCLSYVSKPLYDITVEMGRVLSSDKELIFDLHVNAVNTNLWTVYVADADISVFAFSQVVPFDSNNSEDDGRIRAADPAEYLGGFYHFDEPLSFESSFFSKRAVDAISQIRIKSPGADRSGNERWSRIIRYPYGLVVRGVLRYRLLGFLSPYPQSTTICDVVRVNPATGKVSEDPDQGFCLSYGDNHTVY